MFLGFVILKRIPVVLPENLKDSDFKMKPSILLQGPSQQMVLQHLPR